jgi:membrane protein
VQEDDVFVMASAVAFNILIAAIPLALLGIGLTGYVLSSRVDDPVQAIVSLLVGNLPLATGGLDPSGAVRGIVSGLVARRSGFTLLGALFFAWLATRLVGTLRAVLREIFDIAQARGIIRGKIFDIQVVGVGVVLLTLNLGVTITFEAAVRYGGAVFGLGGRVVGTAEFFLGTVIAFASIWMLFFVVYRYLPARRIPWRAAVVAATFSSTLHEVLKQGFTWYATGVADYSSTWGNLATVAILFFWIYYESLVFILGGEIAQVYTMRKAVRMQSLGVAKGRA